MHVYHGCHQPAAWPWERTGPRQDRLRCREIPGPGARRWGPVVRSHSPLLLVLTFAHGGGRTAGFPPCVLPSKISGDLASHHSDRPPHPLTASPPFTPPLPETAGPARRSLSGWRRGRRWGPAALLASVSAHTIHCTALHCTALYTQYKPLHCTALQCCGMM
jgi:hypothetical protein